MIEVPRTFVVGVRRVAPGHALSVDAAGRVRERPYRCPETVADYRSLPYAAAVGRLRAALRQPTAAVIGSAEGAAVYFSGAGRRR